MSGLAISENVFMNRRKNCIRPIKLRISDTDFGFGHSFTAEILFLSIEIPLFETLNP